MRPNDEHLIRKRSGAREWFRLTKLARSLALALEGSTSDAANGDAPDPWELGLQLARSVHIALGRRRAMAMGSSSQQGVQDAGPWLTAEDVSAAAERARTMIWDEAARRHLGILEAAVAERGRR